MSYEDVPQRLRDGEAVPRSEIIGYWAGFTDLQITLGCEVLVDAFIFEKVYEDGTLKFKLTPLGAAIRLDFITRLEGDCPECPECP